MTIIIKNDILILCVKLIYLIKEWKPFSMQTLRHTLATRAIEAGIKPKTIQKILGHSNIGITMNLHVHITDGEKEKEISAGVSGGIIDLLGNWRSAVLRSNFAVRRSPFSAGILYVFQGKWAKHDSKRASKTVLRKFPRRSNKVGAELARTPPK